MQKIAIVGSGPSGLYLAKSLLKKFKNAITIHVFEKLPEPFGLIKYGIAPDHIELKVCLTDCALPHYILAADFFIVFVTEKYNTKI